MPSTRKEIPTFNSEDEEREFWSHADSTEYIDWSKTQERSLSRLKPTLGRQRSQPAASSSQNTKGTRSMTSPFANGTG